MADVTGSGITGRVTASLVDSITPMDGTLGIRVSCEVSLPDEFAGLSLRVRLLAQDGRTEILDARGRGTCRECAITRHDRLIHAEATYALNPSVVPGDWIVPEAAVCTGQDGKAVWKTGRVREDDSVAIPSSWGTPVPTTLVERVSYRGLEPGVPCSLSLVVRLTDLGGNFIGVLAEDGSARLAPDAANGPSPLVTRREFVPGAPSGSVDVRVESPAGLPLGVRFVGDVTIRQAGRTVIPGLPEATCRPGARMVSFLVTPEQEDHIRRGGPRNGGSAHLRNLIRREIHGGTDRLLVLRGRLPRKLCKPLTLQMPTELKDAFRTHALGIDVSQNELVRALIDADMQASGEVPWDD